MEVAWEFSFGGQTGLDGSGWFSPMPGALVGKTGRLAQLGMVCQMPTCNFST